MARKAKETQGYADGNKSKNFFAAIKAIYCPRPKELAASQLCRINVSDLEVIDSEALGRALQKWPQPFLRNLRHCYRPAPPSGNQRRPGPLVPPPLRSHACFVTTFQWEGIKLRLVGNLRTQCEKNPTTSITPALARDANSQTTTIPITTDHTKAVPPPLTTDTARSAPTVVPVTVNGTTTTTAAATVAAAAAAAAAATTTTTTTTTTISRTPPPQRLHLISHQIQPPTAPPPVMWTQLISVLIVIKNSPHTPADRSLANPSHGD
nr:unnamed protein product [Spirometra erinaceieuropaei]